MQPADYRLVRSRITNGVMMPIKRNVFPKATEQFFSSWLYGQRKSIEQIPVNLSRDVPCLVCSNENIKCDDFCLLTIDINLFLRCLPLLDNERLSILYSLIDHDRQFYQNNIRQQYHNYKQILIKILKIKSRQ